LPSFVKACNAHLRVGSPTSPASIARLLSPHSCRSFARLPSLSPILSFAFLTRIECFVQSISWPCAGRYAASCHGSAQSGAGAHRGQDCRCGGHACLLRCRTLRCRASAATPGPTRRFQYTASRKLPTGAKGWRHFMGKA
jgi:hypothetical protein